MVVLVTRPAADSEATAARLRAAGFEPLVTPLMTIEPRNGVVDLRGSQGVLVTSANGVRALAAATEERGVAVFAVGAASAAVARDAGFPAVASADGDVAALVALVTDRVDPTAGRLVHVAGRITTGGDGNDLAARLGQAGYTVDKVVLYEASAAAALPGDAARALRTGEVDAVVLYSPRSAALFADLVTEGGQRVACEAIVAACLSDGVARALGDLSFARVVVAAAPTEAQLIATLTSALKGGPQHATS